MLQQQVSVLVRVLFRVILEALQRLCQLQIRLPLIQGHLSHKILKTVPQVQSLLNSVHAKKKESKPIINKQRAINFALHGQAIHCTHGLYDRDIRTFAGIAGWDMVVSKLSEMNFHLQSKW